MRAQEQLEGLERLLTNPLAAANAMVYFQLRHLWRVGAQRLEQFGRELQTQREKRERAQLHEAEIAKRKRRLDAVKEKLAGLDGEAPRRGRGAGAPRAEAREHEQAGAVVSRGALKRRIAGLQSGRQMLEEKIEELKELDARRFRASRCRSPKGCPSRAAGSSIRPSSRSHSISSCTSRSTISRRSRRRRPSEPSPT